MAAFAQRRRARFGTPLTRFVAPTGSSTEGTRWLRSRARFGAPATCFVAPCGAPPQAPSGRVRTTAP
eukprot:6810713-Pyramimonas_sp.AAC.1